VLYVHERVNFSVDAVRSGFFPVERRKACAGNEDALCARRCVYVHLHFEARTSAPQPRRLSGIAQDTWFTQINVS
jgi:hypothetical protein